LGEKDQAINTLRQGHKNIPNDFNIAVSLADLLFLNKDFKDAVAIYRKAYLINPESKEVPIYLAKAYEHLGPVYLAQNKIKEAASCYEKIVMLKDKPVEEYLILGNISLYLNKPDKAIEFYKMALGIKPDDIRALNGVGAAYSILSRWDKAITFYQKALKSYPEDEEAKQGLLYALKHDLKGIRANIDALTGASPPARRRGDTGVFAQD
jgi:tetratricopeptide (TPR) repeat protein